MCDFNKGFILCKCSSPKVAAQKNNPKRKKKKEAIAYTWTLYKYLGLSKEVILGRYTFPSNDIGNGLTVNFVLQELNIRNCFDFEYNPNEGDNLIISNAESLTRIEFIFREEQWVEDHYSPFSDDYEEFDRGKVTKNE
jgi:hypothetical protein